MKCKIFINILLLIGVVYLFSMCDGNKTIYDDNTTTHASYSINHYVDTIYGHVIVTTVCEAKNNQVSVATLEIDNFSKIDND